MERVPDGQNRRGNRWSEIPTTVCATFRMCRSLPLMHLGDTIIQSVGATHCTEAPTVANHRLTGGGEAHRSAPRSWLASRHVQVEQESPSHRSRYPGDAGRGIKAIKTETDPLRNTEDSKRSQGARISLSATLRFPISPGHGNSSRRTYTTWIT